MRLKVKTCWVIKIHEHKINIFQSSTNTVYFSYDRHSYNRFILFFYFKTKKSTMNSIRKKDKFMFLFNHFWDLFVYNSFRH